MPLLLSAAPVGFDLASLTGLIPIVLIVVVFYFFLIRPENKKKKTLAQMRDELMVGDEITTVGGIVGKIVGVKEDVITLESGSDKTRIKIQRWAIASKGVKATAD